MQLKGANLGLNKTPIDVLALMAAGANHARWNFVYPGNTPDVWDYAQYMIWIDDNLAQLVSDSTGIKKIVCLMTPPGGNRFYNSQVHQRHFISVWKYIAKRLKHNKTVIGYDILNEPDMEMSLWRKIARDTCEELKSISKDKLRIVSVKNGLSGHLKAFKPFSAMTHATFHCYRPMNYTHQHVLPELVTDVDYTHGEATKDLKKAATWQKKNPKYKIYVGEFSAARWAHNAHLYLREVAEFVTERGWDWAYHAWAEADCWNLQIGDGDRLHMIKASWNNP